MVFLRAKTNKLCSENHKVMKAFEFHKLPVISQTLVYEMVIKNSAEEENFKVSDLPPPFLNNMEDSVLEIT